MSIERSPDQAGRTFEKRTKGRAMRLTGAFKASVARSAVPGKKEDVLHLAKRHLDALASAELLCGKEICSGLGDAEGGK